MRILLTGGGSGGHVYPLVAVARKIKEKNPSCELVFVGPDRFSKETLASEDVKVRLILSGKMRRYFSPLVFLDFLKMPIGFFQAYWHVFWFMPDVVFSKGGYGSAMPTLVAWLFRIPILIHESDSVPGLANKFLAKLARRVFVSFSESRGAFPADKTVISGNPVREGLFSSAPQNPRNILGINRDKPLLFVLGGSQGARQINDLVILLLGELAGNYEVVHQCGKANFKRVSKAAVLRLKGGEARSAYHLYPLLSEAEMSAAYKLASVIVSRAGSGAIFEIASAGKPSVLIPFLDAAGDHQSKNAQIYSASGAAFVLRGRNITPHMLKGLIDKISGDPDLAGRMSQAARGFSKPDAALKIAEEILALAGP